MNMRKKVLMLLVILTLIFSSIPVLAASEKPVIFKDTITVDKYGGKFQVGFAEIHFLREFLDEEMLPMTFEVEIYANDGTAYIEFTPDTPDFRVPVIIRSKGYEGLLYDKAVGENIEVNIRKQVIVADHFSVYAWNR